MVFSDSYMSRHSCLKTRPPEERIDKNYYRRILYDIFSWEDECFSFTQFCIFTTVYWTLIISDITLIDLLIVSTIFLFLFDTYLKDSVNFYEIGEKGDFIEAVKPAFSIFSKMRRESPTLFCFIASSFFVLIGMISSEMPTMFSYYLFGSAVYLSPLGYKYTPVEAKMYFEKVFRVLFNSKDLIEEEDLMPCMLNDNELESISNETNADSSVHSLLSEISSFPSHLAIEEDTMEIAEDDLLPSVKNSSSDSDSELNDLYFESDHFKPDSSSEDEQKFTKDLQFTLPESNDSVDSVLWNLVNKTARYLPNNPFNKTTPKTTPDKSKLSGSSSESDFEIIERENLK